MALAILVSARPGGAQEPLDLHGLTPPPPAVDAQAPLLLWSPLDDSGRSAFRVLGEIADTTAIRLAVPEDGDGEDEVEEAARMGTVVAANVGGLFHLTDRLGVGVDVPLFLLTAAGNLDGDPEGIPDGGGPTLGDVTVTLPVALVARPRDAGLGVTVVPFLRLPFGNQDRFLGDPGVGGGLLAATGVGTRSLRGDVNLGVGLSRTIDRDSQRLRGVQVPWGLAGAVRLGERAWLGAEVRGRVDVAGGAVDLQGEPTGGGIAGAPAEGLLTLRMITGQRGRGAWSAAVGRGLNEGLGAANVRLFGGYTRTLGGAGGPWRFEVVDPEGAPIEGAELALGGAQARTGAAGRAVLADARWSGALLVSAPGFASQTLADPPDEDELRRVVLEWQRSPVLARITDEEGAAADAVLRLTRLSAPAGPDADAIEGPPGGLSAPPGRYRVAIRAPGLGDQSREFYVPTGGAPTEPFDVVLLPDEGDQTAVVRVVDAEGAPVRHARVMVDGRPVGTTADGGYVAVAGLGPGAHAVEVLHADYTPAQREEVPSGEEITLVLRREPGSVRVVVRDPQGRPVTDAVARFVGPRRLPPVPLGPGGRRVQVLGPGTWTLLVSSQAFGVQERQITVPPDSWRLIDVLVVMIPPEDGEAALTVQVVDPSGRPVDGVRVALGDAELGETSTGGTLSVRGLAPGRRLLRLSRDRMRPVPPRELTLAAGAQQQVVEMAWRPGQVDVVARTTGGPVPDATVRFLGPSRVSPMSLGPDGESSTTLAPGRWNVLVTSEQLGAQQRRLEIPADSDVLHVVEFELSPSEGGLAELSLEVTDPEGRPVDGAQVWLDGVAVGATSNVGTLAVSDLVTGRRVLTVRGERYAELRQPLKLVEGPQEAAVRLGWGTGAVRVAVTHEGAPVPDAMLRFLGPERKTPIPVGRDGRGLANLSPGRWVVLATSESTGVGERTVRVPEEPGLTGVQVALTRASAGTADLALRVVDPAGAPIEGATVLIDGAPLPSPTGAGGLLVARGLQTGEAQVGVRVENYRSPGSVAMALEPGLSERVITVDWERTLLTIRTVGPDGAPVAARVQPEGGPTDMPAVQTAASGQIDVRVPPGDWRLLATSGDLAAEARQLVQVGQGATTLTLTLREASAKLQGRSVEISDRVQFDFNLASLRPDAGPVLDAVARVIRSAPQLIRIEVQGHTDNIGDVAVNQELSQLRAKAVVDALVARGVAPEKLVPVGYGRSRPRTTNDTIEGRAENRRVQFEVLEAFTTE